MPQLSARHSARPSARHSARHIAAYKGGKWGMVFAERSQGVDSTQCLKGRETGGDSPPYQVEVLVSSR